jgi:hypothetical protein
MLRSFALFRALPFAVVVAVVLALWPVAAHAKPPRIRAVAPDAAGVAFWSPAGDWFLVQSRDYDWLIKVGRDGRRLGRTSLAAAHKKVPFDLSVPSAPHAIVSPDGKQLAFPAGRGVWLFDIASGVLTPLRRDVECVGLVWLPGGKELLVSIRDGAGKSRHERIDAATGDAQPVSCQIPVQLSANFLDETHLLAYSPALLAVRVDCGDMRPLVPFSDEMRGLRPRSAALSPKRIGLAVLFDPTVIATTAAPAPTAAGRVSLWAYSRDDKQWTAVAPDAYIAPSFVWLDDDTLIYEKRPGPDASEGATLHRFTLSSRKSVPLILPPAGCGDGMPSAPGVGGALTFQRTCSDKKKSAVELVSP